MQRVIISLPSVAVYRTVDGGISVEARGSIDKALHDLACHAVAQNKKLVEAIARETDLMMEIRSLRNEQLNDVIAN